MNKIKCFNCGIANWASAEICVKCKERLEFTSNESAFRELPPAWKTNAAPAYQPAAPAGSRGFFRSPMIILGLALIGSLGIYFFFFNSSSKDAAKSANDSENSTAAEISVAAPPPGMNVTPPNIANFTTLVQNEIRQNNSAEFSTEKSAAPVSAYPSKEEINSGFQNLKSLDEEAREKLGPCDYTINDCQQLLTQRKNEIIRERNSRESFFASSKTMKCPPQVKGDIKLTDGGKYHKFDDQIYYVVKVRADGLEGFEENKQCSYKPAIAGLTAQIYLKWGNSAGWQASSKIQMQTVSLEFDKKKREKAAREREKKKNPNSGIF